MNNGLKQKKAIQEALKHLLNRGVNTNKYNFGHVLIVGGSPGMVGAPLLAATAALRIGAGLATIASTKEVTDKLERRVEEIMTLTLPKQINESVAQILDFTQKRKVNVLCVGPGLNTANSALVRELIKYVKLPVVLDASGIGAFQGRLSLLKSAGQNNPNIVLTPHVGEYEHLTDVKLSSNQKENEKVLRLFAKKYGVTVVLKGHHTLVGRPDGSLYVNQTGNPGLATAGTGDVLAGIISGLAAQGIPPALAAEAGVYIHGLTGDIAASVKTELGMIASDLVDFLPMALKELSQQT